MCTQDKRPTHAHNSTNPQHTHYEALGDKPQKYLAAVLVPTVHAQRLLAPHGAEQMTPLQPKSIEAMAIGNTPTRSSGTGHDGDRCEPRFGQ